MLSVTLIWALPVICSLPPPARLILDLRQGIDGVVAAVDIDRVLLQALDRHRAAPHVDRGVVLGLDQDVSTRVERRIEQDGGLTAGDDGAGSAGRIDRVFSFVADQQLQARVAGDRRVLGAGQDDGLGAARQGEGFACPACSRRCRTLRAWAAWLGEVRDVAGRETSGLPPSAPAALPARSRRQTVSLTVPPPGIVAITVPLVEAEHSCRSAGHS